MLELPPLDKPYTCQAVMQRLREGNDIFCRRLKAKTMKFTEDDYVLATDPPQQEPYAAILSCADSRVIPEHAFWAGEGELFVCRNAGNISPPTTIASLEYAVAHLHVPVIVVMGHEVCGAVKATLDLVNKRQTLGDNLNEMAAYILPAVNMPKARDIKSAVIRNAKISAEGLTRRSDLLQEKVRCGELLICAAYFHLSAPSPGRVDWLEEYSCP
ncbi:MAG: carbonic anhydrase [Pirellulaceae bacterium]